MGDTMGKPSAGKTTAARAKRRPDAAKGAGRKAVARPPAGKRARKSQAASAAPQSASSQRGKYVYCIIRAKDALSFGRIGIGGEPTEVHTVNYKDLAAVV